MKVKLLKNNEIVEVNDCYGARLIEQGKAILVKEKPRKEEQQEKESSKKAAKGE